MVCQWVTVQAAHVYIDFIHTCIRGLFELHVCVYMRRFKSIVIDINFLIFSCWQVELIL